MPYLKLEINRPDGSPLFWGNFGAEHLAPFAGRLSAMLMRQKVLPAGEKCTVRFIPRTDSNPNFDQPVVLAVASVADDRQGDLAISFESEQPPAGAINYLTLSILATEAK